MFYRIKKTRKYHAPSVKVTQMALESNFCQTAEYNAQVDALEYVNSELDETTGNPGEVLDIEF